MVYLSREWRELKAEKTPRDAEWHRKAETEREWSNRETTKQGALLLILFCLGRDRVRPTELARMACLFGFAVVGLLSS